MIQLNSTQWKQLAQLVRLAGDDIVQIYHHPESIQRVEKADKSPLTAADLAAHKRLVEGLGNVLDLPILSEESHPDDYTNRRDWESFWLIDPLDGTKEFLARNGQFTVNVALIHQGQTIAGMVYQPVTQSLYWGAEGQGAFKQIDDQTITPIHCESLSHRYQQQLPLRALVSQHHHSLASQASLDQIQQHWPAKIDIIPLGSSLKICAIAEGSADLYLRLGPTSEWDTAAAQAVLQAAGGQLVTLTHPPKTFTYNQRDSLLNNDFCACDRPDLILHWLNIN